MSDPTTPPPAPPTIESGVSVENDPSARSQAMVAHLLGLTYWLGPLIFYLLKKDDPTTSPFVKQQSKEVLNWGITITIGAIIGVLTSWIFCIGAILNLVIFVTNIVFVIVNAMKANKGEAGTYPFSIKFVK